MHPLSADVSAVLNALSGLALQSTPSAAAVTVTLVTETGASTIAATSDWADSLDVAQYAPTGGGPCVDAAVSGTERAMTDTSTEVRWPLYVAAARKRGARSSLSLPIPSDDNGVVCSLNAFSQQVAGFGAADRELLVRVAGAAAAALSTVDSLQAPWPVRAVVDQARGIVMATEHCTATEALDILTGRADAAGATLRAVSADLVRRTSHP
jgi:GAF domain-containing protein